MNSANYFSNKKGKALFMHSVSKELGTIKRKKSIKEFDPYKDDEEKKETNLRK